LALGLFTMTAVHRIRVKEPGRVSCLRATP
jgi:hypothetical protein